MPKVSEAHTQARRKQILEGARRAFARHGYEGATVAKLEDEIGLSRGAIFNYFPDKWSLFLELAAQDQDEFMRALEADGLDGMIRSLASDALASRRRLLRAPSARAGTHRGSGRRPHDALPALAQRLLQRARGRGRR